MNRTALVAAALLVLTGCAASHAQMPTMSPLSLDTRASAPILDDNHFSRDRNAVGEAELKQILAAPVFLEEHARIGVVPVQARYEQDDAIPLEAAPATLVGSLETSGMFDLASEVSTEWPTATGVAGLRELAARYRAEYLLLYRHRFTDATRPNAFAWGFITLVGALFLPGTTFESAGVLEATLFEVKTGTILFTVHERVRGEDRAAPPQVSGELEQLHRKLVKEAALKLAEQVRARCHRLIASRPGEPAPTAAALP